MKSVTLIVIGVCFGLHSCTSDKSESHLTPISGYYKVKSISSNVAVDMNNDGVKSADLYSEITAPYKDSGLSFFDFESPQNHMEVRPLPYQSNDAQLISLNIPDQYILESNSVYFLGEYLRSFIAYRYEMEGRSIKLISTNPAFIENGTLGNFQLMADGNLKLEMSKKLFDFKDVEWKESELTIIYSKVE